MKTKILIAVLSLLLIAAGKPILSWGKTGDIRVVAGGVDGEYSVNGGRKDGQVWQYMSGEPGQYTLTAWCKGNTVFTLQQDTQIFIQTCNSSTWQMLTFPPITKSNLEIFLLTVDLKSSDYADMLCLFPSDVGSCTYFNHVTNYSFEQR